MNITDFIMISLAVRNLQLQIAATFFGRLEMIINIFGQFLILGNSTKKITQIMAIYRRTHFWINYIKYMQYL